ncbi:hypothetical protein [Streptomyces sp. TP-A0356]|uniref:hypothetical protein n=1 Tax=Streptomyces sp. TP-A0356 TaxID=1359208 RepID=UPI0006E1DD70|nr:hypothetical protein [Streptomyces sp. TP-A0356]
MNEPTPLAKAEAAVSEAENNSAAVQLALAAVELAKTAAAQQQTFQQQGCQHHHGQDFNARKWLTLGGLAIVGGCVACFLAMAFAVAAVAVGIGGACATGCFLILRSLWRDYLNTR